MSNSEKAEDPEGFAGFDSKEMDKIIRQVVDKVRGNYYLNGATGRGIPGEVKKIIEQNVDRM